MATRTGMFPPINLKNMPDYSDLSARSSPLSAGSDRSVRSAVSNPLIPSRQAQPRMARTPTSRIRRQGALRTRSDRAAKGKGGVLITQLESDDSDFDTDLENDETSETKKRSEPSRDPESPRVMTEKKLYLKMCRTFGVVPASYYVRNMSEPELRMRYHGLGPSGTKALSVPLQINTSIMNLDLEGNWMEAEGARHVAFMLKENIYISDLNLSYNRLKSSGGAILCKTLRKNVQIKKLDLSGNGFLDKDAAYFKELLETNTTLRELSLSNNEFSELGAMTLGRGIASNDTVETMDLSWNHIRLVGAEGIARGLRKNNGIMRLNLSMNGFATNGAKAVASALEYNSTLVSIDLSNNRIDVEGCASVAKCLRRNDTLRHIHLGLNPITYAGAMFLIKSIEENEDSVLELLDLMGVLVHHDFMDITKDIKQQRTFEVKVGFVSTGKELEGNAQNFSHKNPLEILLIFMSEQNLRLVDLFKSLDKDQSMSLTREEFIEGLKTVNTPLSQSQLDQLIDMLDKDGDGEVDLKEIMNINREYKDIKIRAAREVAEKKKEKLKKKLQAAAAILSLAKGEREEDEELGVATGDVMNE